jgi:hypothetical protein
MTTSTEPPGEPQLSLGQVDGAAHDHVRDRLIVAQWVFERHLAWIAAAEVKVGVIVAIQTAMLGGLAAAFSVSDLAARTAWAYLATLSAAGLGVLSIFCAAMVLMPRTSGPETSLLFFAKVTNFSPEEYFEKFLKSSPEELLRDWTAQIHRNAEIAMDKYFWVRRSIGWAFFSTVPWIFSIGMLVKI